MSDSNEITLDCDLPRIDSPKRKAAEEWVCEHPLHVTEIEPVDAHLAGQECGEQRAVERICKRLRYWQSAVNAAFDYAADIENGGWKETP